MTVSYIKVSVTAVFSLSDMTVRTLRFIVLKRYTHKRTGICYHRASGTETKGEKYICEGFSGEHIPELIERGITKNM